jgi:hypothetical protein
MRSTGHRFERPQEAVEAGVRMRGARVAPSDAEVALAMADADCRISSGLTDTVERVYAERNAQMLRENERVLDSWA